MTRNHTHIYTTRDLGLSFVTMRIVRSGQHIIPEVFVWQIVGRSLNNEQLLARSAVRLCYRIFRMHVAADSMWQNPPRYGAKRLPTKSRCDAVALGVEAL